MAEESQNKWECEYCTFQNWQAAKKCTICQATKPMKFITENTAPDIYQVASLAESTESINQSQHSDSQKWSCSKCTYLNWNRSKKCVVCLRPKSSGDEQAGSDIAAAIEPLTINVDCPPGSGQSLRKASPNTTGGTKEWNNDRNKALATAMKNFNNKWLCKVCTYENWPKACKCSICGSVRSSSTKDLSSVGTSQNLSPGSCGASITGRYVQDPTVTHVRHSTTSPPNSPRGASASSNTSLRLHRKSDLNRYHDRLAEIDWLWLKACAGVIEGDRLSIDAYLATGGDAARQLNADEAAILGSPTVYQKGHTLVHLALQSQREDLLALLLTAQAVTSKTRKRLPPHVCPDLASEILRTVACSLRQRKGDFPCSFLTECVTFALPADIADLLPTVEKQLLNDILDQDVQKELQIEESIINWSLELCEGYGSRLFALWNRSAGDCLLDSVLQATWGVFDKDNTLRLALSDSLTEGEMTFYSRWKEHEGRQALLYDFTLEEDQWHQDWSYILSLARQPGSALEQAHIFALAHILRRPIVVYGVKYVKSYRGETIDLARFQGVYLPLLWESSFCWKSPITLGYTRGHFSALVPMKTDIDKNIGAGAMIDNLEEKVIYLPLTDKEGSMLPLHFLNQAQMNRERAILREWLVCREVAGIFCAEQQIGRQPPLVNQMTEEWFERYRHLSQAMQVAGMSGRRERRRDNSRRISMGEETDDE